MAWCLIKSEADKFKKALKSGEIDPQKLSVMTSSERHSFLAKFVGEENATNVNGLFESKLLLKNQKAGMISWAKNVAGISPKVQRDIISKIERLEKVLDPASEEAFLEDLAATRLGLDVSYEEAKQISDFSKKVVEAKKNYGVDAVAKMSQKDGLAMMKDPAKNKVRLEYGDAVIALDNYVTDLKMKAGRVTLAEFKSNPIGTTLKGVKTTIDLSKSMKASYDDSAILNQGFPILANYQTAPIWAKNALGTFVNMVRTFKGKPVWDKVRADVVSRPNYLNGLYKKNDLAVNVIEEAFPTSIPEKMVTVGEKNKLTKIAATPIRLFGKGYKATEVAFNAFQMRNRVDVFDLFASIAEKQGRNLSPAAGEIEGLGKLVNALTSRGRMGPLEPVANIVNAPFFSLRKQAAAVESLFFYQVGKQSGFTRKMGAIAAIQQIALIVGILGVAKLLKKDSVETDTTSSDFGKIRIGSTRFDVTQGRAAYLVLASRIIQSKMKSSTSGKETELNTGKYSAINSTDLIGDFTQNKFSPFLNELIYIMNRQDREGNKPTVVGVLADLYVPLGIGDIPTLLNNPDAANFIAASIANAFGVQSNTYPNTNIKSGMIPKKTVVSNDSFINAVLVYSEALKTDPETAFNRIFTGQKIMQVSGGGIVVVDRQDVSDSQEFKKKWVLEHGGNTASIREVKLDHIIPNKLGGSEKPEDWAVVSTDVWSGNTKVENTLIQAVKDKKISLKEAQKLIVDFKRVTTDSKGYKTENPDKKMGEEIIKKYK